MLRRRHTVPFVLSVVALGALSQAAASLKNPLIQAAGPGAPGIPPAAHGIYVWPYNWAVKNGDFDKALNVPGVDGVGVHVTWSEISPTVKTYNFTAMDQQLAKARAHDLSVELAVQAGQGNPEWLFAPRPTGLGLQRLDFEMTYHGDEPSHRFGVVLFPLCTVASSTLTLSRTDREDFDELRTSTGKIVRAALYDLPLGGRLKTGQ
jgi:hypothetical protein